MLKLSCYMQKGEKIEAIGKFSRFAAYPMLLFLVALIAVFFYEKHLGVFDSAFETIFYFLLLIVLGLIPFLWMLWYISKIELVITDKRILYKKGILRESVCEMALEQIVGTNVVAGLFGRIIGYYSFIYFGSGIWAHHVVGVKNGVELQCAVARFFTK